MTIDLNELLEQYRAITSKMTNEKYDYLKNNEFLSPVKIVRLALLEKNGANEELLMRVEYAYLFERYANHFYKMWKELEWGTKEDESLYDFADKALDDSVFANANNKIR